MKTLTKLGLLALVVISFSSCSKDSWGDIRCDEEMDKTPDGIHFDINWDCEDNKKDPQN